jgi:hypothetical protein
MDRGVLTMNTNSSGVSFLLLSILLIPAIAFPVTPSRADLVEHHAAGGTNCSSCHQGPALAPDGTAAPAIATHLDFLCTDCHDSHGETSNLRNIKEVILTPNSGPRDVIFLQESGMNSYADGDTVYDGVCEVCHTGTRFHRNNQTGNHMHYKATHCVDCHPHDYGFDYVPVTAVIDEGTPAASIRIYPSPSRGPVTVMVTAPSFGREIRAAVWDVNGRVVRQLAAADVLGGKAIFRWDGTARDGSPARSGVYFCVVSADGNQLQERFVLLR